jgi:hypothetical protein
MSNMLIRIIGVAFAALCVVSMALAVIGSPVGHVTAALLGVFFGLLSYYALFEPGTFRQIPSWFVAARVGTQSQGKSPDWVSAIRRHGFRASIGMYFVAAGSYAVCYFASPQHSISGLYLALAISALGFALFVAWLVLNATMRK